MYITTHPVSLSLSPRATAKGPIRAILSGRHRSYKYLLGGDLISTLLLVVGTFIQIGLKLPKGA